MPAFPNLQPFAIEAIVRYITTGEDSPTPAPAVNETYVKYRFTGYRKFLDPDGYVLELFEHTGEDQSDASARAPVA